MWMHGNKTVVFSWAATDFIPWPGSCLVTIHQERQEKGVRVKLLRGFLLVPTTFLFSAASKRQARDPHPPFCLKMTK